MPIKTIIYACFLLLSLGIGISSCSEDDPVASEEVAYNSDVSNLMFNFCTTCHSGAAASANLDLSTYDNVKEATESGSLLNRINDSNNPMPPSGLLSQERRDLMNNWASGGYKEN